MTFLILLALNALFGVVVFLYFRERFQKVTKSDEIKQELASVIHAFNSQADRQITILEDLLKRTDEARKILEHRVFEARRSGGLVGTPSLPLPNGSPSVPAESFEPEPPPVPERVEMEPVSKARGRRASISETAPKPDHESRDKQIQAGPAKEATPWVEKDYVLELDEGDRAEREREERLVETLRRLEDEKFSRLSLTEQVRFLHLKRGQSVREIGRRLGLSHMEIEMMLRESIREQDP